MDPYHGATGASSAPVAPRARVPLAPLGAIIHKAQEQFDRLRPHRSRRLPGACLPDEELSKRQAGARARFQYWRRDVRKLDAGDMHSVASLISLVKAGTVYLTLPPFLVRLPQAEGDEGEEQRCGGMHGGGEGGGEEQPARFRNRAAALLAGYVGLLCCRWRYAALVGTLGELAELLGVSPRCVEYAIQELEREGWIERLPRFEKGPFGGRDGRVLQYRQICNAYRPAFKLTLAMRHLTGVQRSAAGVALRDHTIQDRNFCEGPERSEKAKSDLGGSSVIQRPAAGSSERHATDGREPFGPQAARAAAGTAPPDRDEGGEVAAQPGKLVRERAPEVAQHTESSASARPAAARREDVSRTTVMQSLDSLIKTALAHAARLDEVDRTPAAPEASTRSSPHARRQRR